MASVFLCCARPARSIKLGFHQNPSCSPDSSSLNLHSASIFRFKNSAKLLTRRRLPLVHASNKPSEEPIGKTEAITSGDAQGPPFLTILAGIVVFALLLWLIGSVASWLIGLFGLIFSK